MSLLLESNIKLDYTLNIDLYFDDKTEKHHTIKVGDNIIIMYSNNGEKLIKTGVVKSIIPINIYDAIGDCSYGCSCCNVCKSTAMIRLDASNNHQSDVVDILAGSILDIDIPLTELTQSTPIEPEPEDTEIV